MNASATPSANGAGSTDSPMLQPNERWLMMYTSSAAMTMPSGMASSPAASPRRPVCVRDKVPICRGVSPGAGVSAAAGSGRRSAT